LINVHVRIELSLDKSVWTQNVMCS